MWRTPPGPMIDLVSVLLRWALEGRGGGGVC